MNSLDDLRRTLDAHAGAVPDDAASARVAAVRGRAHVVRRRRAAGVAGAAALALVGALVVPQLAGDRQPGPADRTFLGKVAPATLQSYGHTFRFSEGVAETSGRATVRLDRSDAPRLVSWAAGSADDVTVRTTGERGTGSTATDFDDFLYVPPGASGRWSVTAGTSGATALAVYELDEDVAPDGLTVADGLTFRRDVPAGRLVTAGALEDGASVLTVTATVPENERLRLAEFCQGVPMGTRLWVNVSVDGNGATASGGCDDDDFDPATGSEQVLEDRHLPEPGQEVELTMWVSRGVDGDPIAYDGARLALGVYDVADPVAVVGGWDTDERIEHDGHVWSYVGSEEVAAGASRVVATNDSVVPLLAVGSYERAGGVVSMRTDLGEVLNRSSAGLGGRATIDVLNPGDRASVVVSRPLGARGSMGIALYERLD